jgi:hypothetical protein
MTSTRGKRLQAAREKHFKSARAAAIALDFPMSSYGAHERAELAGGRDYDPEDAKRYAKLFGVTPEWLLTGYKAHSGRLFEVALSQKVRIIGYVGTRSSVHLYHVKPEQMEQVDVHLPINAATVGLDLRESTVTGLLPKNWFLIYDDEEHRPSSDLVGKLCVIAEEKSRIALRVLRQGRTGIRWAAAVRAILPR